MIRKNSKALRGFALGLTLVAVVAIVVALVVGYRKNGEINFLLIGIAAVLLTANLLVSKKSKTESGD